MNERPLSTVNAAQGAVDEIAPGIHRIAVYHEPWRSSVNLYVIADREPTLISTGLRAHFDVAWALIGRVLDPGSLHRVVVPHFAASHCGALNEFLTRAPDAIALASTRTVLSSLHDFAIRAPRGLADGELIPTGMHGLRVLETPYVHSWDSIMLVHEHAKVVFSSGLFVQPGRCEALTRTDRSPLSVQLYQTFFGAPPESYLLRALDRVEGTEPAILAPVHGSALTGVLTPYFRAYRALVSDSRAPRPAEGAAAYR
jgi:flavorubredoxin